MSSPDVHEVTREWWESLGGALTGDDEGLDWPLLRFLDGVGHLLGEVADLVRDTDAGPGWSVLLDVDRAPANTLPYLAQFVGVRLPGGLTEAQQRQRIKETDGWRRGSPGAIKGAARQHLTGTQTVRLRERLDDHAYRFRVRTYEVETPDQQAVEEALRAQKPAGLTFVYEVVSGWTWEEAAAAHTDWAEVAATYDDWDDFADEVPET